MNPQTRLPFANKLRLCQRLAALVCLAAPLAVPIGASARTVSLVRIAKPGDGSLVSSQRVAVVVRTAPGVHSLRAWFEDHQVTGPFHPAGRGVWKALFPRGRMLGVGVEHLYVTTSGGGFATSRFVLGRRSPGLVSVVGSHRRRATGSVNVAFHAPADSALSVSLNGRAVMRVFGLVRADLWSGRLGVDDGLRFGANTLTVQGFRDDGNYDRETITVVVSRRGPLVGAPDGSAVVNGTVRLDALSSRPDRRGDRLSFRWQVVGAPSGAPAAPLLAATAEPTLRPRAPGRYRIELVVSERRPGGARTVSTNDIVTVEVRPNDLPIGATIDTLDDAGQVVIADEAVPGTGPGLSLVVLRRSDRSLLYSTNVDSSDTAAVERITAAIGRWADEAPQSLVIVTGTDGVSSGAIGTFDAALRKIGGSELSHADRQALDAGAPFSVVGVPGAAGGAAFTNFGAQTSADPSRPTSRGDLAGYLQVSTDSDYYGFVSPDYPTFDTRVAQSQGQNMMRIGDNSYTASLAQAEAHGTAGFHVVIVDRYSLQVLQDRNCVPLVDPECPHDLNEAWPTNTGNLAQDRTLQADLASRLEEALARPDALVFIQSIGDPKPTTTAWNQLADAIVKLGGTRTVFDELDGTSGYALLGGPGLQSSEASKVDGTPRLNGILARNRSSVYGPFISDAFSVSAQLVNVLYQPAEPFPAFSPGEQAADAYLAEHLNLVGNDVRANYWGANYVANWGALRQTLDNSAQTPYPGDGHGFTQSEFEAVRHELSSEMGAVAAVKTYIENLEKPFVNNGGLAAYVQLEKLGRTIKDLVKPPDDASGSFDATGLLSQLVSGASGLLAPPESYAIQGLGVMIKVIGKLDSPGGSQIIGQITTKVNDLSSQLVARLITAQHALDGVGKIMVSDYGKLMTVAKKSTSDPAWIPPATALADTAVYKGMQRWFYSELMPVAWNLWQIRGAPNAREWYCFRPTADGAPANPTHYHIFGSNPDTAQYTAILGFNANMTRDTVIRALGIPDSFAPVARDGAAHAPDAKFANPLFQPLDHDSGSTHLGLHPQLFYEHGFTLRNPPQGRDAGLDCYRRE